MQKMSAEELEAYAKQMGFTLKAYTDKADKIDFIQRKRSRTVAIDVLGLELSVSVKRARSSKFNDVVYSKDHTNAEIIDAFRALLGDSQFDALLRACADDDGEVDEDALAYAFVTIIKSDELKNY